MQKHQKRTKTVFMTDKDSTTLKSINNSLEGNGDTEPKDELRMTFRCPSYLIEKLDEVRKSRPGIISRNQAIVEALSDYLESDES
jgi:hypothetical protein